MNRKRKGLAFITLAGIGCLIAGCGYVPPCRFLSHVEVHDVSLRNVKDMWQIVQRHGGTMLLITCPSGIGSASVHLNVTGPCPRMSLGLRYSDNAPFTRLEGFQVVNDTGGKWGELESQTFPRYMRVRIPGAALNAGANTLTIDWVDMYR